MEYKILERDAKLGDYSAASKLQQRQEKLEPLPIRDAFGYTLAWCPEAIPDGLLDDINKMYNSISVTDIDTDISIEKESFHSCRIEGPTSMEVVMLNPTANAAINPHNTMFFVTNSS